MDMGFTNGVEDKHKRYLVQAGALALVFLSLFLFTQILNGFKEYQYIGASNSNTITVSGQGEALAVPDVAVFTATVTEEADDVATAQDAAATAVNDIIAYLDEQGVAEKDIKTTGYNVYPRYEYPEIQCITAPCPRGERTLVGYEVSQTVRVKVRDTEMAGSLLSGVGSRGVSNISGLSFEIDDDDALRQEARRSAINDAKEKARVLANDLGVDLVRVVNFYEESGRATPYAARNMALEDAAVGGSVAPSVPTGENEVSSNVTIVYEIR